MLDLSHLCVTKKTDDEPKPSRLVTWILMPTLVLLLIGAIAVSGGQNTL
jgi:hypothetical protein